MYLESFRELSICPYDLLPFTEYRAAEGADESIVVRWRRVSGAISRGDTELLLLVTYHVLHNCHCKALVATYSSTIHFYVPSQTTPRNKRNNQLVNNF